MAALLDGLEQPEAEGHSIMVIRPSWWAPFSTGRPHPLYPLTKSFRPDVS